MASGVTDLEKALIPNTAVYSPYGGKEVLQPKDGRCVPCMACASQNDDSEVMWTIQSSVWVNFLLFVAKIYAFFCSGSLAVLASLVDSTVDLIGQGALWWTKRLATGRPHSQYPVGRGRLEPVGVMICAVVMGMASIEVISTSVMRLCKYWNLSTIPSVVITFTVGGMLMAVVILKGILYVWCLRVLKRHPNNESVKAIAQDNINDVMSNIVALIAPTVVTFSRSLWVVDPVAGIAISIYIIYTWITTGLEQVEMIVGKRADPDFLIKVMRLVEEDTRMQLDHINAYHFGPKYLVELEVVMPEGTALRTSHDAGIVLQHKVELFEEVERCFVHIDYQLRLHDDHDPEVPIEHKLYGGKGRALPRVSSQEDPGSPNHGCTE